MAVHALALASVIVSPWPWVIQSLLLIPLGLSAWLLARPRKIIGLRLSKGQGLECWFAGGERIAADILPDTTVFSRLVVLRLLCEGETAARSVALLPDSLSPEDFRLLRLWLRWQATTKESDASGV